MLQKVLQRQGRVCKPLNCKASSLQVQSDDFKDVVFIVNNKNRLFCLRSQSNSLLAQGHAVLRRDFLLMISKLLIF